MSNIARMMQRATAGAGGAGLDVDEVFNTFLYTGTGSAISVNNGIDLSGEGGLVWVKGRNSTRSHYLYDTERGTTKALVTSQDGSGFDISNAVTAFNNNGFTLGTYDDVNSSDAGKTQVAWTFRKAEKFFDVVTWTGTGSAMTIDHNLGQVPGMIIVKSTSATYDWAVWHREFTGSTDYIKLNSSAAKTDSAGVFGNGSNYLTPTSTQFFVGGNNQVSGEVGGSYVAYLFAHNNNDGEFGPDSDQDIIKCGSYTGNGSNDGPTINLGFEPQWLMIKDADGSENWQIFDNMRGMPVGQYPVHLYPNSSAAEGTIQNQFDINSTGFKITFNSNRTNANGDTYIYMAIRRGPLAAPDDATKVFAIDTRGSTGDGNEPAFRSTFPVDFALQKIKNSGTNWTAKTRLLGAVDLNPNTTGAEQGANNNQFDYMNGHFAKSNTDANEVGWMWKRAPEYFDVVVYSGPSGAGNISHNLGVVPEMMWVKNTASAENWAVYHKDLGNTYYLHLNTTAAASNTDGGNFWNSTTPTASVFSVGTGTLTSHYTRKHVAYLFATVPNVSKVGSYTGTGSALNIDCGFSSGARFVMVKRTDTTGAWRVFDTERGIVSGADPFLDLDSTAAENSGDLIDPYSSGFSLSDSGNGNVNASGNTYIFYAIA